MEKLLFHSLEEFQNWKTSYPNQWIYGQKNTIQECIKDLMLDHFPCVLVFSVESDSDEGTFIVSEFVYSEDFAY